MKTKYNTWTTIFDKSGAAESLNVIWTVDIANMLANLKHILIPKSLYKSIANNSSNNI